MSNDVVQIGPFIVSTTVFVGVLGVCASLLGVVLTYFTSIGLEKHKRKQQLQDEQIKEMRQALAAVMGLMQAIGSTINHAELLIFQMFGDGYLESEFDEAFSKWPSMGSVYESNPVPQHLYIWLPDDALNKIANVEARLDVLRTTMQNYHATWVARQTDGLVRGEVRISAKEFAFKEVQTLRNTCSELHALISSQYKSTYKSE